MSKLISLWSGPRNVSTALMYSFAQRSDTTVQDEPLYAHYLRVCDPPHPGKAETLASMENDGEKVIHELLTTQHAQPVVFLKQMAHFLVELDLAFLKKMDNLLLIRHPREVILSFSKVISHPIMRDIGIKKQYELYQHLKSIGQNPPILDSKEILLNPQKVLIELCEQLDIPFEKQMLSWKAGPRPYDGTWAKYWYHSVNRSTGFATYTPRTAPLAEHLKPLLEEALPYYEALYELAIKA